jgi:hypothetical protein
MSSLGFDQKLLEPSLISARWAYGYFADHGLHRLIPISRVVVIAVSHATRREWSAFLSSVRYRTNVDAPIGRRNFSARALGTKKIATVSPLALTLRPQVRHLARSESCQHTEAI